MHLTKKPILLIGMMGAGKSTLGALLAEALGRDFYDLDAEIEKQAEKTIPEIFAGEGEEFFRALEAAVLKSLLAEENAIIAAGGGILESEMATTIWLTGEPKVFFKRAQKGTRPKLGDFENFSALYETRKPGYAKADFEIDNNATSPHLALAKILKVINDNRN
ncbi:MAG: shikimate kinase [Sphingomonadales bacterium]